MGLVNPLSGFLDRMENLYRYIPIWRRDRNGAVLYRVFEVMGAGYAVQSKDFYQADASRQTLESMDVQCIELFSEEAPEQRSGVFPTIEAAILSFDQCFEDGDAV